MKSSTLGRVAFDEKDRLFSSLNLIFIVAIAAEILTFMSVIFGPLIIAAVVTFTRVRTSRWRIIFVWALALVSTAFAFVIVALFAF